MNDGIDEEKYRYLQEFVSSGTSHDLKIANNILLNNEHNSLLIVIIIRTMKPTVKITERKPIYHIYSKFWEISKFLNFSFSSLL